MQSNEAGTLTLYSLDGKELQKYAVSAETNQFSMPAGLSNGIYMCRFNGYSGSTVMIRLIYQR